MSFSCLAISKYSKIIERGVEKGRAMFFWPETIVASFLHLMVLLFKVLLNHSSKRQFLVLHCRTSFGIKMKRIKSCVKNDFLFIHKKFICQLRITLFNLDFFFFFKFPWKFSLNIEIKQAKNCIKNNFLFIHKNKNVSQPRTISFNLKDFFFFKFSQKHFLISKWNALKSLWKIIF